MQIDIDDFTLRQYIERYAEQLMERQINHYIQFQLKGVIEARLTALREERDSAQRRANNMQAEIERLRRDQRLKKCPHCSKRVIHLSAHIKRAHKK